MKISILAAFALLLPLTELAMTPSSAGVGPSGYNWLIGTWLCANTATAAIGGPGTQTVTYAPTAAGGLSVRVIGGNFERSGYIAYVAATKTWWSPIAYPGGNFYAESTKQTGSKTIWTGPYTDVAGRKTFAVRDMYTVDSATQYEDIGQYKSGSSWKTGYRGVCRKTS